jgi:hypothetical protein
MQKAQPTGRALVERELFARTPCENITTTSSASPTTVEHPPTTTAPNATYG